jgi:hypothetical protein
MFITYVPGHNDGGVDTLVFVVNVTGKTQPGPVGPDIQLMLYGDTPPEGATLIAPSLFPLQSILVGVVITESAAGLPTVTETVEVHP